MNAATLFAINELKKQLATVEQKLDRLNEKLDSMAEKKEVDELNHIKAYIEKLPTREDWQTLLIVDATRYKQ